MIRTAAIIGSLMLLAGCRTPAPGPVDLAAPGWITSETDAIWQPGADAPGIAGELILARHPDGIRWVQFSKQGLPLVTATAGPRGWQLRTPLREGVLHGRGNGPRRVPWFLLDALPPSTRQEGPWRIGRTDGGRWLLENRRTGESLEGLDP